MKRVYGSGDDSIITRKKNAFLYPNDPEAEFPQAPPPEYIERRARYLPYEYLLKNKGIKAKNLYKKEKEANLKKLMEIAEGKLHENEAIDIEDMGGLVDNVDNLDLDEEDKGNELTKKVKKIKEIGMDIDDINTIQKRSKIKKIKRNGYRHKKKSNVLFK
jgi:hypothetical protein